MVYLRDRLDGRIACLENTFGFHHQDADIPRAARPDF
jgi:hypothetical protein